MGKNMEYISDTQTLIGQQKRTLIDQETGEVVHVGVASGLCGFTTLRQKTLYQ
ncbi:hypothetical protein [Bacillus paranthracis]|uniref:hypothetical protein n=1 Tax=Bacillus paranthracis TaxID=2026186 RepID=UPI002157B93E|nr:hypothetical protein [Bacillus paranthracis]MCR6795770.1 hypothetical protein [Bacillus paranthracis]MCR6795813.1 hypothetical protein [Bacillus paranthracis]MED1167732.1 hypothetical protein [Bacillus paranthracis]